MLEKSILIRARITLLAHQKLQNVQISQIVDLGRHGVGRWRKRWQESVDALLAIEPTQAPSPADT